MKRILVTGSRDWDDVQTIKEVLAWTIAGQWDDTVIVHGDCPTGADAIAESLALKWAIPVERHPADWHRYGKSAGPRRNQQMADIGADLCLAFPMKGSKGTFDMIRKAKAAGIETRIYLPRDTDTSFT